MTFLTQNAIFGLLVGGLYGLAAVGLSLVFGVLKMLNVAHGELIMLGGYIGFWLFTLWGVDPFLSLVPSALLLLLVGMLLYRALFSRLIRFPMRQSSRTRSSSDLVWPSFCKRWPSWPGKQTSGL